MAVWSEATAPSCYDHSFALAFQHLSFALAFQPLYIYTHTHTYIYIYIYMYIIYIYIYIYIYISSNLHPSPNSRWLHHTALRYVRRAQSGAYMWWKGLNSVKTGSKRAKNTCLSIPNGPGSLLEKRVFDPFLTHCWSQNGPFSRHFGIFHGPTHATTGSTWPKNTCLSIPSGLGTTLEKIIFFALGTLVDPPLAPTVRGLAGPPAAPSDHWYGGLRVSLGESEAWKPQNVGGCGWTRCPQNSFLSHVAQDTARSWFRGAGAHCAVFGAFWRLFGPFLGHIVELEGTQGPLVARKSSRTWSVGAVCLRLAVLNPY